MKVLVLLSIWMFAISTLPASFAASQCNTPSLIFPGYSSLECTSGSSCPNINLLGKYFSTGSDSGYLVSCVPRYCSVGESGCSTYPGWCKYYTYAKPVNGCKPLPGDPLDAGWCEISLKTYNNGDAIDNAGYNNLIFNFPPNMSSNLGPVNAIDNGVHKGGYYVRLNMPTTEAKCVARSRHTCSQLGATYDKCDWADNPFAGAQGNLCHCAHYSYCPGGLNGPPCWSDSANPPPSYTPCGVGPTPTAMSGMSLDCNYSCDGVPLTPDMISTGTGLTNGKVICQRAVTNIGESCPATCASGFAYNAATGDMGTTPVACTTPTLSVIYLDGNLMFPLPACSPSPSPSTPPFTSTPPFDPMANRCGAHAGYPTSLPSPRPSGMPDDFNALMNPMAACCWNGWARANDPASRKMDCMERNVSSGEDFLKFYNEGGPRGNPSIPATNPEQERYAGVLYPNRLFMLNSVGTRPVNGFYNAKGERCGYRNPANGAAVTKTAPEQMALFDSALDASAPPPEVLPNCCNLILLGLERKCPDRDPSTGQHWRAGPPESTYTRCTAASEMKVHFGLFDLCDPSQKKRARFHGATSIAGISNTDSFPVAPLELDTLIKKSFPTAISGECPVGFTKISGKCVIQ